MNPDPNLLSRILIIPGFLDAAECAALRAELEARSAAAKPARVHARQPATLDPSFWSGDIVDPSRILRQARESVAGRYILERYGGEDVLPAATAAGEIAEDVVVRLAVKILTDAVNDRDFYSAIASRVILPPGSMARAELEELLAEGTLVRTGTGVRQAETLSPEAALSLEWFHVRLLEEVVFPGSIHKSSRFLRRDVNPGTFMARLQSAGAEHPGSGILALLGAQLPALVAELERGKNASFLSAFRRILWTLELQNLLLDAYREPALALLDARDDRGRACFDALRCREGGAALREQGGPYPRCRAIHAMLHLFFPDDVQPPADPGIDAKVRSAQVLEDAVIRPRLDAHVERLAREYAQPFYGIHIDSGSIATHALRYSEGGHYVPHVDSERFVTDSKGMQSWVKSLPRDLSVLIYLSRRSDFDGGELDFPGLRTVSPLEGMAVMFPSDHRFPHAARPVTRGTRYALVSWLACAEGGAVGKSHQVTW